MELAEIGQIHGQLMREGRWGEALEVMLRGIELYPENGDLRLLAGLDLLELGHPAEAVGLLAQAHQLQPQDMEAHLFYGIALHRAERLPEGMAVLESLLERHPDHLAAVAHRGLMRVKLKDPKGEQDLRRFLLRRSERTQDLLGPDRPLLEEAAAALQALGRPFPVPDQEGIQLLALIEQGRCDQVAQLRPSTAWHHYFRAEALKELGKPQEAAAEASRALQLEPQLIDAYRVRAEALSRCDPDRAVPDYERYLKDGDPWAGPTWGNLGIVHRNQKRWAEGAQALQRACDLLRQVDNGYYWEHLAICELNRKRYPQALGAIQEALGRSRGTSPLALYYRGCIHKELGRFDEARADLQSYLQQNPQGNAAEPAQRMLAELPKTAPAAPAKAGGGFFSKLFGGGARKPDHGVEDPDDAAMRQLKACIKKGNWKDLQRFLEQVRDDVRGFYVYGSADIKGRPAWLDAWTKAHENSAIPWLFRGRHSCNWAWEARGDGWGDTVSRDNMNLFVQRLHQARQELLTAASLDPRDPNPYASLMTVCLGLGEDHEVADQLLEQALQRCPGHRHAHQNYLYRLADRWYGQPGDMMAYARRVISGAPEGSPLFTLVARAAVEQWMDDRGSNVDVFRRGALANLLVDAYRAGVASPRYVEDLYTAIDLNTWAFLFYQIGYKARREVFERVGMRKTEYPWVYMSEPAQAFVEAREFCLTS